MCMYACMRTCIAALLNKDLKKVYGSNLSVVGFTAVRLEGVCMCVCMCLYVCVKGYLCMYAVWI